MTDTALNATGFMGPKLYQKRARKALPILIAQAEAGVTVTYTKIANELGMTNARNMNDVLRCVGNTLIDVGENWEEEIPLLQSLVVKGDTGLPGVGIEGFFDGKKYSTLKTQDRRRIVDAMNHKVYQNGRWPEVLKALDLKSAAKPFPPKVKSKVMSGIGRAGGEGKAHKDLKAFILNNPQRAGIRAKVTNSQPEKGLLSGDSVDVYFETQKEKWGIEVKSHISGQEEIIRGMFQVIKYRSVMEAEESLEPTPKSIEVVLVIEGTLSPSMISLSNRLGVTVIDRCIPT